MLLTGGQVNDITQAFNLLEGLPLPKSVIADKAYDSDRLVDWLEGWQINVAIPPNRTRLYQRPYDRQLYKQRNRIERVIQKLKHFRHVATRYDKTAQSYLAMLALACSLIWLRF